jgi:antitoxin component YwqK of YwqJK toxin-antitoxin module
MRIRLLLYIGSYIIGIQGFTQPLRAFYDDGGLKYEGEMREDQREGIWTYYYPNGEKSAIEKYSEDLLNGKVVYYDTSGNVIGLENWVEGLLMDSAIYYYSNGTIEMEGKYMEFLL